MGGAFGPAHCSFVGFTALRSFPRNRNAPKNTGSFLPFFSLLFRSSPPLFFLDPRVFSVSLCLLLYLSLFSRSSSLFLYPFACSSICPCPLFSPLYLAPLLYLSPGGKDQAQPKILLRISSTIERNLRSVSIRLATALHEWSTVEWSRPAICAPMCCKE